MSTPAARVAGFSLLRVKALGPEVEDAGYAGTRAFCAAAGFVPPQGHPPVWGQRTPCFVIVRPL